MTWFLFVIYLSTGSGLKVEDIKVEHGAISMSFNLEKDCIAEMKRIFKDAKADGNPVPKHVNIGCVPFKDNHHFDHPMEDERSL